MLPDGRERHPCRHPETLLLRRRPLGENAGAAERLPGMLQRPPRIRRRLPPRMISVAKSMRTWISHPWRNNQWKCKADGNKPVTCQDRLAWESPALRARSLLGNRRQLSVLQDICGHLRSAHFPIAHTAKVRVPGTGGLRRSLTPQRDQTDDHARKNRNRQADEFIHVRAPCGFQNCCITRWQPASHPISTIRPVGHTGPNHALTPVDPQGDRGQCCPRAELPTSGSDQHHRVSQH